MVLAIADYGYLLETGRIVLSDTCKALMENEEVKDSTGVLGRSSRSRAINVTKGRSGGGKQMAHSDGLVGREISIFKPSGELVASMPPPWFSTILLVMARPNPDPVAEDRSVR